MKKNTKLILLILTLIIIITAITFYFQTNTYEIVFYNDGNIYETINVRKNKTMTRPNTPIKDGYIFLGWYDQDNNLFDFKNNIDKNMILVAHWGQIVEE